MADYLRELGVSDCYASPLFKAGPQSTHGYDVCGFGEFNPGLGSQADFTRFTRRLHDLGLGLLLDMVPNHMSVDSGNAWWQDLLRNGPASRYARWFDISWDSQNSRQGPKVVLPVLEDIYGKVLEAGKLKLVLKGGDMWLAYHDRRFPLSRRSRTMIRRQLTLGSRRREEADFDSPPAPASSRRRLQDLNGRPGDPASFDFLDQVVRQQAYRLVYWKIGPEEINYRRFFDITELVSLRMELPEVFAATHCFLFDLVQRGLVTGLRIDHPDGLWNPKQYFERLQAAATDVFRSAKPAQPEPDHKRLYVVAEKILTSNELLREDWPVSGTTGYDFLNEVNGLFVLAANRAAFDRLYNEFTGAGLDFRSVRYHGKKKVLRASFIGELDSLAKRLEALAEATRYSQDFTLRQLRGGLEEIIAEFPVYRTYISEETEEVGPFDRDCIRRAVAAAQVRSAGIGPDVFAFIESMLLLTPPRDLGEASRKELLYFVMRFQQLTGPVMAKGLEDTAFYNFNRLISLNEVGGDPEKFGMSVEEFHARNLARARDWPHTLLATATHDTKRGEDSRARINVLSEMADVWQEALVRWSRLNAEKRSLIDGEPAPHPNDEYFLYQTLVGAWPLRSSRRKEAPLSGWQDEGRKLEPPYVGCYGATETGEPETKDLRLRLSACMLKAIRESKAHTSWTSPNPVYEEVTRRFVEGLLMPAAENSFLKDFLAFQRVVSFFGQFNSLSQTLLKLTSPGVPDVYQGAELWDFSLVDPDNRRPVDYEIRQRLLSEAKAESSAEPFRRRAFLHRLVEEAWTGQIKLHLIWRALEFRRAYRQLFAEGSYVPLSVQGTQAQHVCAFARVWETEAAVIIVPRLVVGLLGRAERPPIGKEVWKETLVRLNQPGLSGAYRNVLTQEPLAHDGEEIRLADALAEFPVALLEKG
jgi:(1->4)-alpha-D-glucan 1-alpha-D-glucosylmutase